MILSVEVTGLFLTATEHSKQLCSKLAAREEIKKKVGDVVEVEQKMSKTSKEFVFDGVLNFCFRCLCYE